MVKKPLISVVMITYNHENYIREAMEGVLMQECNFEIELIVANDCSTDNTNNIIQDIIQQHRNASWIKYTNHTKNKGMMPNFIWAMQQCQGKYIALCEGDDYWIDPLKLQKQVDFLEANPDYTICFHKVKILQGNTFMEGDATEKTYSRIKSEKVSQRDLILHGNFMHTPSVVFRNVIKEFPFEFSKSVVGDYFLHIMVSEKGYIKRLEDRMCVYRTGVGIFSSKTKLEMYESALITYGCLLSYLKDEGLKKIALSNFIIILENHNSIFKSNMINSKVARLKSFKDLLKIFIYKLKYLFLK
ncbi:glycosyltransferase family 2 protein [Lutibacter sp.]|uniref:glycosyltransferase family 2 protein n=1 Tax=Lutibacter sp. TaxID=1925666 RepID=UPI0027343092|nr:glycosyltransferase family 2 protein [Lutibacter sp.]MDP3312575.1 glycosyltransferase family 2 protein [Lutibacter sp.]